MVDLMCVFTCKGRMVNAMKLRISKNHSWYIAGFDLMCCKWWSHTHIE
jgi:hypothetical protein